MNLKSIRESRGLSQKQLAEALGLDRTTINKWESGVNAPTASMLLRIADYFHVTTDYLLGRDETAATENGQKEKPVENDGPEAGLNMDVLTEDERAILDLLRQVPDEDLPAARRAIKAMLAGMKETP